MTDAPPQYTVTETVWKDGRKALYRAIRVADHVPVVLKTLEPERCRPRDLERLRHEHEIANALDVRAVVKPLALETYQGLPVLVLEDFGGRSLDRVIAGPVATDTFLDLAVRIAGAVSELHRHGVIHRDLKPENILVHPSTLEVKLADLGLATRLPREQQAARPPPLIEGSLPYMSPEQTGRMNRAVDSRTDLYSLGVTFYQMLTGRLPFAAGDPLEWVHCHVARAPPAVSQLVPDVPAAIERIVMKLLAKIGGRSLPDRPRPEVRPRALPRAVARRPPDRSVPAGRARRAGPAADPAATLRARRGGRRAARRLRAGRRDGTSRARAGVGLLRRRQVVAGPRASRSRSCAAGPLRRGQVRSVQARRPLLDHRPGLPRTGARCPGGGRGSHRRMEPAAQGRLGDQRPADGRTSSPRSSSSSASSQRSPSSRSPRRRTGSAWCSGSSWACSRARSTRSPLPRRPAVGRLGEPRAAGRRPHAPGDPPPARHRRVPRQRGRPRRIR